MELAIDVDASVADALDEDFHGREWTVISVISVITVMRVLGKSKSLRLGNRRMSFKCTPRRTYCQLSIEAPLAALEFELRNVF